MRRPAILRDRRRPAIAVHRRPRRIVGEVSASGRWKLWTLLRCSSSIAVGVAVNGAAREKPADRVLRAQAASRRRRRRYMPRPAGIASTRPDSGWSIVVMNPSDGLVRELAPGAHDGVIGERLDRLPRPHRAVDDDGIFVRR